MKTRFPLPTIFLFLALCAGQFISPSHAWSAARKDVPEAQTLIDACWEISRKDRESGVTGRMRNGAANTVGCLEEAVLDQLQHLFPDGKPLSREKAQEHLDRIQIGVQKLYWSIYNEHAGCDPFCGTMYQVFHLSPNARILEDIIRTLIRQRKEYGL